jgi:hypothetical protein
MFFCPLGKAHGGKKPPCVLLNMLGFSAAIFIRFGMWMQAFSPMPGLAKPLLNASFSYGIQSDLPWFVQGTFAERKQKSREVI